jgi:Uncharacterized protein conserved in bacteria (DUF2225)
LFEPTEYVCAYALCYVALPKERQVQIRLGTNDSGKMWTGGGLVFDYPYEGTALPDREVIPVTLPAGTTPILLKICNGQLNWGFVFRITNLDGPSGQGTAVFGGESGASAARTWQFRELWGTLFCAFLPRGCATRLPRRRERDAPTSRRAGRTSMPELRSPFVEKSIKCPSCGQESRQRFFRQRLFMPAERESDQHVIAYKWMAEDVKRVHPPFYYIFHCPHCHFSDIADDYVNNRETLYAPRALKAIKKGEANQDLVGLLAQYTDDGDISFAGALNLLFLTIHYYSLAPDDLQDTYKLGRLLLRVAWLYREQSTGSPPEAKPDQGQVATPVPAAENCSPAILEAIASLEECLAEAGERLEGVQGAIRTRIREIARSRDHKGVNPYPASSVALRKVFEEQAAQVAKLKEICNHDAAGPLLRPMKGPVRKGGVFLSHEAVMERLRVLWPEAPTDESQALKLAVEHLQRALAEDRRLDDFQNHSAVSRLVIDLMLRRGDANGAYQTVNGMYREAADARQRLQERLRDKELSDSDRRRIEGNAKRANETVERAADMRTELLDKLLARDLPRIKQLVRANARAVDDIEKFLAANGILPEVMAHLKKSGKSLTDLG